VRDQETDLHLLNRIEKNPQYTQRKLSSDIGVSLGKVNYCLKKLIGKGWVKVQNFSYSSNKVAYIYLLTPKGVEQKTKLTYHFLQAKMFEYDQLKEEIIGLQREISRNNYKTSW